MYSTFGNNFVIDVLEREGAEVIELMQIDLAAEPHTAANEISLLAFQMLVHVFDSLLLGFEIGSHTLYQLTSP
mgnify:CR=1 FL=1